MHTTIQRASLNGGEILSTNVLTCEVRVYAQTGYLH